jgi:hypothetical protein
MQQLQRIAEVVVKTDPIYQLSLCPGGIVIHEKYTN